SRFIASNESEFHKDYKDIVPPAQAQDTILVTGFFGPIRLWKNRYARHHGLVESKEEKIAQEKAWSPEEVLKETNAYRIIYEGDTKDGAVLLGQSIGIINSIDSVPDIINSIVNDAEKRLKNAYNLIK
ncbi:MAG: hypothetical protein ACFFAH_09115, partial [Promethearchaeota archaeon]